MSNNRRFVLNKDMIPRKDYDDYSRFINEQQQGRRRALEFSVPAPNTARHANTSMSRRDSESKGLEILTCDVTKTGNFFKKGGRGMSFDTGVSGAHTSVNIKPRIIESRISENKDFYNLSDGFKRIFANDKKDKKLVIPVVGYGGHRRGDRSQNYFGKSYRDTTIQSKCLEREFRPGTLP